MQEADEEKSLECGRASGADTLSPPSQRRPVAVKPRKACTSRYGGGASVPASREHPRARPLPRPSLLQCPWFQNIRLRRWAL